MCINASVLKLLPHCEISFNRIQVLRICCEIKEKLIKNFSNGNVEEKKLSDYKKDNNQITKYNKN